MASDETEKREPAPEYRTARRPAKHPERPVLPKVTRDETDVGWGDEPSERDAEWYRRERPPHHE